MLALLAYYEVGKSIVPRQPLGQGIQILGTVQVGTESVSASSLPIFYLIEEEKKKRGKDRKNGGEGEESLISLFFSTYYV